MQVPLISFLKWRIAIEHVLKSQAFKGLVDLKPHKMGNFRYESW